MEDQTLLEIESHVQPLELRSMTLRRGDMLYVLSNNDKHWRVSAIHNGAVSLTTEGVWECGTLTEAVDSVVKREKLPEKS